MQLVFAGPTVHYEHLRPAGGLLDGSFWGTKDVWLFGCLLALGVIVGWAMRSDVANIARWLASELGVWRFLVLLALLLGTAAFPSREIPALGLELGLYVYLRVTLFACAFLVAVSTPLSVRSRLVSLLERGLDTDRIDRVAIVCALWSSAMAATLAWFSYGAHPHIPDEVAYLYQARYFARGQLGTPVLAVPYQVYLMACDAVRCYSPFPPGGGRLLCRWACLPVLHGL